MKHSFKIRCLRAAMPAAMLAAGLALLAPAAPAAAQGDIGAKIEQEYGVVGSESGEGRRLNAQLDEVVNRVLGGMRRAGASNFRLRSARLLGGRSEKVNRVVNAFALPDGRIYVTLGLMRMIQNSPRSDDELAFVVGHEITHVAEKHSANQMKKSMPANIAAVLLGAATRNRALGQIAGLGAQAYSSKFSREDEYRADRGGLTAMHYAGYDANASITMLQRLKAQGGEQSRTITGWFGSHPLTENRVSRVQQMIAQLRSGGSIATQEAPSNRRGRDSREYEAYEEDPRFEREYRRGDPYREPEYEEYEPPRRGEGRRRRRLRLRD